MGSNPATPTVHGNRPDSAVPSIVTPRRYACEEHRRDPEPDPGAARHRGAVRRAQAEPGAGVPGDRRAGHGPGLPSGQGAGRASSTSGSAAAPSSTRPCRRRSRSTSWPRSREHEVKTLGQPEVEITEFNDGEPLKFTAEVDVRPEITLPDLDALEVTVDDVEVDDDDVDEQLNGAARAFRHAEDRRPRRPQDGDYVADRPARHRRRRGGARRLGDQHLARGRQRAAARRAWTRRCVGLAAGDRRPSPPQLRRRRLRRRGRRGRGHRRSRQGEGASRARRRLRAAGQRVRHPRRAARRPARAARQVKQIEQSSRPATSCSSSWSRRSRCRLPESAVKAEVENREHAIVHQLERIRHPRGVYLEPRARRARSSTNELGPTPRRPSSAAHPRRVRRQGRAAASATTSCTEYLVAPGAAVPAAAAGVRQPDRAGRPLARSSPTSPRQGPGAAAGVGRDQ